MACQSGYFGRPVSKARGHTKGLVAVGVGFEPTEGHPSTVFKTAAFDHSASPPKRFTGKLPAKCAHYIAAHQWIKFVLYRPR